MARTEKNIGICLARIVFSFLVVCCHFFSTGVGESVVKPFRGMAVPVFFIISFYFFEQSFASSRDISSKLRIRLLRILAPLWFWGIVFAPLYAATIFLSGNGTSAIPYIARDILLQMLFGHVYDHPLWFLFVLAALTVAYGLIKRTGLSFGRELTLLVGLVLVSYWLQYSGYNVAFWNRFGFAIRFPMGRIAECIPFAVAGVAIFHSGLAKTYGWRHTTLIMTISLLLSCPFECLPWTAGRGFEYAGLYRLRAGIGLFLLFVHLPSTWLSDWQKRAIERLSSFSLGVFCIHVPIGFFVEKMMILIHANISDLGLCLVIYSLSVAASWTLVKIAGNAASRFVE